MHVKINIPKQRKSSYYGGDGCSSYLPEFSGMERVIVVPIETIALDNTTDTYRTTHEKNDYGKRITRYYVYYTLNVEREKKEILPEEYERIMGILDKLNFLDAEKINEQFEETRIIHGNMDEKVLREGDINGLLGLEV